VSLASLLLLVNECIPDVASISAAAGVPLVPDVLTVAGFPTFVAVPGVVGFPAVTGFSSVAVVPAVDGVFAVASFPSDPGAPRLLYLASLRTVLYSETYTCIGHRTIRL
jgi:hypothetical protein